MATLELEDVTKTFAGRDDAVVAVEDLSLSVGDGEFLVLVGPSGCGKSTTLRTIAGLERPTSGEVRIDGEVVNDRPPQDRDMAMVFQSYALYPHMTVRENMAFGLEESTDVPSEEIRERVEETAAMMEIAELLDRKPADLSGGQQQRVALGRAIVRDPAVFLMDEPLSNLDAKLRSQMRTELQRLQEDLGVTTVYVTHDQTEAMTMGDRIAILDAGELQQVGTPLAVYHRPSNLFVAGFVGEPSMNFFDVDRSGDRLVGDGFVYRLSAATLDDLGDAQRLVLGVRPEDVEVVAEVEGDHDFEAVVDVVEPRGSENDVHLRFAERESTRFTPPSDEERADRDAEPVVSIDAKDEAFVAAVGGFQTHDEGETVVARIPEDAIHLFDRETGEALHNRVVEGDEATFARP
jgi:multiple sugar transport system ATP-binding protein